MNLNLRELSLVRVVIIAAGVMLLAAVFYLFVFNTAPDGGPAEEPAPVPAPASSPVPNTAPAVTSDFAGSPTSGKVPLTVRFTDRSTESITAWRWDFGDGANSTDRHPSHTYNSTGSYTVSLTVTGPDGSDIRISADYITVTEQALKWSQTFGGADDDFGLFVQQTSDTGYIVVGSTESYGAGASDIYLLKTDAAGIEEWSRTFGGPEGDIGYLAQQTTDGGYIIAGVSNLYESGGLDMYLLKTDDAGAEQWNQTFGSLKTDFAYSVQQTTDGGYIILGEILSYGGDGLDIHMIKIDAGGEIEWSQTFGGSNDDRAASLQQTADGGYIVLGETRSYGAGGTDVYLLKTDADGIEEWSRTFGGSKGDGGYRVQQTSDGGYIIAGSTKSYGAGGTDVYLLKTDADGIEEWGRTFGGAADDFGRCVQQTTDGGYIVAGSTKSYGSGDSNIYLVKTDENGDFSEIPAP